MKQDYRELTVDEHEAVERQTLLAVVHALQQYSREARSIFNNTFADSETEVIVLAEDIVQYAIEVAEVYPIDKRFAGFTDYKRVRWMPTPYGILPQALLVDAKASKELYRANLQRSQLPMVAEFMIAGRDGNANWAHSVQPGLPPHLEIETTGGRLFAATTSIFVHLHYQTVGEMAPGQFRDLQNIIVFCLPHGRFKDIYNPNADVPGFWRKGKESPGRSEAVRIRVSFEALEAARPWRVQQLAYEGGVNGYTIPVWNDIDPETGQPVRTTFDFIGR